MKNKHYLLASLFAVAQIAAFAQPAQGTPGSGWTLDPSRQGMQDLRAVRPIEGCMAPGGLQRIISSDEPGSGAFWCGPPPYCLTQAAVPGNWHCTIVQYSRRDPRGDPNGRPGANPVRNPQDLRCVNTGNMPVNGRCPLPPPPPPPPPPDDPGDPPDPDDPVLPGGCGSTSHTYGYWYGGHCEFGVCDPRRFQPSARWTVPSSPNGAVLNPYRGSYGRITSLCDDAWTIMDYRTRAVCSNGSWRFEGGFECSSGTGAD